MPEYDWEDDAKNSYLVAIAAKREQHLIDTIPGVKRAKVFPNGGCELLLGDCLEIMPHLPKVEAVVTDPPYGISHSSNHGASWNGRQILSDQDTAARDAVVGMTGTLPGVFFGTWKTPPIQNARACVVWDKGPAFGMGDLSLPFKPSFELAYICGKGWRGERGQGVLRGPVQVSWEKHPNVAESDRRKHPHQKPVWLFEFFLEKLPDAHTILDPFVGSGTTLVACAKLGRKGIGIEIDPDYFDIAVKRVEEAYRQPDLFVEPPKAPVQEGFDL